MNISVGNTKDRVLHVSCPYASKWRLDSIPSKLWDTKLKRWIVPIIQPNIVALRRNFKANEFSPEAIGLIKQTIAESKDSGVANSDFPGVVPSVMMSHQKVALDKAHDKDSFFFAHAMGAGKSLTVLTLGAYLYKSGDIEGLLVVCPSSIRHDTWENEINKWLPQLGIPYDYRILDSGKHNGVIDWINEPREKTSKKFQILVVGIQALSNKKQAAYDVCYRFLMGNRVAMMVDESSKIKNPKADRTKNVIGLGELASKRWCGTGTEITQGIHDLYSQFRFLDWKIIGHASFYSFRNRYCVMGGFENKKIMSYKNTNELIDLIGPFIDVVRKEDANELPPKNYHTRMVAPSAEQKSLYNQLRDLMEVDLGEDKNEELKVNTVLERMIRYQQLAGGNLPYKDADGEWNVRPLKSNPKLDELVEILDETDGKVIIWAVFVEEIKTIVSKLEAKYGQGSAVAYYGGVSSKDRSEVIGRFNDDPQCRFFVANQVTAGMGLTLVSATTAIYYSNSFSYEDRAQSEDRNHRTGQTQSVNYINLFLDLPVDRSIKKALAKKTDMAKYVASSFKEDKTGLGTTPWA
jgi:SNF2 family DNA or RNA helicase